MILIKETVEIRAIYNALCFLRKEHYKSKEAVPFEMMTRVLMSEETKRRLKESMGTWQYDEPETIYGVKILIDNEISFGSCKIFQEAKL